MYLFGCSLPEVEKELDLVYWKLHRDIPIYPEGQLNVLSYGKPDSYEFQALMASLTISSSGGGFRFWGGFRERV